MPEKSSGPSLLATAALLKGAGSVIAPKAPKYIRSKKLFSIFPSYNFFSKGRSQFDRQKSRDDRDFDEAVELDMAAIKLNMEFDLEDDLANDHYYYGKGRKQGNI